MGSHRNVVQFSTGGASAEVLFRVAERDGVADTLALTADTLVEDDDNWRFARDVIRKVGCRWVVLADGRTPMGVGSDLRVVPNNRMAVCSRVLKRELLRAWIDEHCDPTDTTIHLGFDWWEQDRIDAARPNWQPYVVDFPLTWEPLLDKADAHKRFEEHRGIRLPILYELGFEHANCGGGCVRGGLAQWAHLLRVMPERFAEWEAGEEGIRVELGKDVAILRHRSGKREGQPFTLREFRERQESQPELFDVSEWGACSCF